MDKIEFRQIKIPKPEWDSEGFYDGVEILINGTGLLDIVYKREEELHCKDVCGYVYQFATELYDRLSKAYKKQGKALFLACGGCRYPECASPDVAIKRDSQTVRWHIAYRSVDYGIDFIFDKKQYLQQMRVLNAFANVRSENEINGLKNCLREGINCRIHLSSKQGENLRKYVKEKYGSINIIELFPWKRTFVFVFNNEYLDEKTQDVILVLPSNEIRIMTEAEKAEYQKYVDDKYNKNLVR